MSRLNADGVTATFDELIAKISTAQASSSMAKLEKAFALASGGLSIQGVTVKEPDSSTWRAPRIYGLPQ